MLISYKWLQNLVETEGVSADDAAARITARGLEVEGMTHDPTFIDDIKVAKIIHIAEHPNSDHLHLVDVDAGTGELIRVVCGAPGIQEGWVVPFAPIGAKIGDFKIKVSKLRGEVSNGMLCSEKELGLGSDNDTLLRLDERAVLGAPLRDALSLSVPESVAPYHTDIFEIGLTPDRGDCLSHFGVARELAAALSTTPKSLKCADLSSLTKGKFVSVESADDCPRYMGIRINHIKVAPSPVWLRRAVEACGARSINNIVDITNYICFELGHPMHAFDSDKLAQNQILVRRAKNGESILAINHETYALTSDDLVITDGVKPVAVAGVMGGADTEVSDDTKNIIFEIATFHPTRVRKTSKRLGLHSESSHRYERFVDPAGVAFAAARALWLLQQTQNDDMTIVDIDDVAADRAPIQLTLRKKRVNDILGIAFSTEQIQKLLQPIGFASDDWNADDIALSVPTWRADITREIDIIEELCRGYGFDHFPAVLPDVAMKCVHKLRPTNVNPTIYPVSPNICEREPREKLHALRKALIDMGVDECMHYTFMDPADPARLNIPESDPIAQPMKIANPMSVEHSAMRTTMLPSMLNALIKNMANQQKSCALFEVGEVFFPVKYGDVTCLDEHKRLCVLFWGEPQKTWFSTARAYDVFDLKGCLEETLHAVGASMQVDQEAEKVPWLHDNIQAAIRCNDQTLGYFGELHPLVARHFKISGPVFIADLRLDPILSAADALVRMKPLARFHFSTRDQSFVVPVTVTYRDIEKIIESVRPKELESWQLFDVYRGKQILPGLQSISLTFRYRHPQAHDIDNGRPLSDDEVNAAHATIVSALSEKLDSKIR